MYIDVLTAGRLKDAWLQEEESVGNVMNIVQKKDLKNKLATLKMNGATEMRTDKARTCFLQ